jgi:ABC-type bacteriocin/lantibiotic exporter with double-glycine peptidase domain
MNIFKAGALRRIHQIRQDDCGIACVAIIANTTYKKSWTIIKKYLPKSSKRYTRTKVIRKALIHFNIKLSKAVTISDWSKINKLSLVAVNFVPSLGIWHWVIAVPVADKIIVIDPAQKNIVKNIDSLKPVAYYAITRTNVQPKRNK